MNFKLQEIIQHQFTIGRNEAKKRTKNHGTFRPKFLAFSIKKKGWNWSVSISGFTIFKIKKVWRYELPNAFLKLDLLWASVLKNHSLLKIDGSNFYFLKIYDAGDFSVLCSVMPPRSERWQGGEFLSPERVLVWSDEGKGYLYKLPAK